MGPNASLKDLEVLQNMVGQDPTLALKVLPVIWYHLRPDKLQSLPHPAPPSSTMLFAESAMRLLTHCVKISAPPRCSQSVASKFASSVEDHWLALWSCCVFMLETCVEVPTLSKCNGCACSQKEPRYINTIQILLAIARHPSLRGACITSTEDMLHDLTSLWLRESKATPMSISHVLSEILAADSPLDPQLHNLNILPLAWSDAFEALSTACLQRIKPTKSSRQAKPVYEVLFHDIVVMITSTMLPQLHDLLVAKKSVEKVVSLLRSLPLDALLKDAQVQNLYLVMVLYLKRCIDRSGVSCVVQAMKERVVVVLFDVMHCLGQKIVPIDAVSAQLLDTITPFFVHRLVLREAKRSMEIVIDTGRWCPHSRPRHMLANTSTADAGEGDFDFSDAANGFHSYMRDRTAMKIAYNSTGTTDGCSNPTVRFVWDVHSGHVFSHDIAAQ